MDTRQVGIGMLIASGLGIVVLQVALAPSIAVASVVPNFAMVAVGIVALYATATRSAVYGFLLGFCYDLFSTGPIGVMALLLTVMGYALSSLSRGFFEENRVVEMLAFTLVMTLGEVLQGVVLAVVGYDSDILYSLVFRCLPGAIYEIIIGLLVLAVSGLVLGGTGRSGMGRLQGQRPLRSMGKPMGQGRPLNRRLR